MSGWPQKLIETGDEPDPRFTFANERTFLAWIQVALALVAAGLAASQLLPLGDLPGGRYLLGLPLIGLGAVASFTSYTRWWRSERALRLGEPLPHTPLLVLLGVGVGVVAITAAVLVIAGGQG